ncbi:MAG: hypothetical protein ACI4JJ_03155 [Huintestinicola sp.]
MKIINFELLTQLEHCIGDTGSVDDFEAIAEDLKISGNLPNFIDIMRRNDFFDDVVRCSIADFLSVYAERFPDSLMKQDDVFTCLLGEYIKTALLRDISAGRRSAEVLADLLHKKLRDQYFSEAVTMAIFSKNKSFFDYIIRITDKPVKLLYYDLYKYLSDTGRYDIIEKMMEGASRNEKIHIFNTGSYVMEWFDIKFKKTTIEYLYELSGYIIEEESRSSYAQQVSDIIEETHLSISFGTDITSLTELDQTSFEEHPTVRCWRFMIEKGLKFRSLDFLFQGESKYTTYEKMPKIFEILKNYIIPILDDKVTINENFFSAMNEYQREMIEKLTDIIGAKKVWLDCTGSTHVFVKNIVSISLIRKGVNIIFGDDIESSAFLGCLVQDTEALSFMLFAGNFTDEQVLLLAQICAERKQLHSLNIIRKYLNEEFLQN